MFLLDIDIILGHCKCHLLDSCREGIFHKLFAGAQLDLTIKDRFGNPPTNDGV